MKDIKKIKKMGNDVETRSSLETSHTMKEVSVVERQSLDRHILFLSHAGADTEAAATLAKRIEDTSEAKARNLKVWFDKTDLRPGGGWQQQLEEALQRAETLSGYLTWASAMDLLPRSIVTHENRVHAVVFSPDGSQVATASEDHTARVWHLQRDDLIAEACTRRLPRNLTHEEWRRYLGDESYRPTCPNLSVPSE